MIDEVEPPTDFSSHSLAEYLEALCLIDDVDRLSPSELRSKFPSGQQPSSAEISFGMAEIERRAKVIGESYPYDVRDSLILRNTNAASLIYDFLCLLSLEASPLRGDRAFAEADRLFDAVVREAVRIHLGPSGQALCFGWPPREGRPSDFVQAVSWVGKRLGVAEGVMDRPSEEKDAGVDVIGWKPFSDGRTGFPVLLVQNTIKLDYANKPRDVVPTAWMQWLRFGTPPSVGFAIPFAVQRGDDRWPKMNDSADVILDRLRLAALIAPSEVGSMAELSDLGRFNEGQLEAIRSGTHLPSRVARPRRQRKSTYRSDLVR